MYRLQQFLQIKNNLGIKVKIKELFYQFVNFMLVSGIGFIMDFGVFYFLTAALCIKVVYANMISAVPAITWVFLVSTKKIFQEGHTDIPVWLKYIIYLFYQACLLVCVSWLAQFIYDYLEPYVVGYEIVYKYLQLLCKCLITPITMICNFIVMKNLAERI